MNSVTNRIKKIKQPYGGYIPVKSMTTTTLSDPHQLYENENIHSTTVGMAVDYLTRFMLSKCAKSSFKISLLGAKSINESALAHSLLNQITDLSDTSIIAACKLTGFDVCVRAGTALYKPVQFIQPDEQTCHNIRIMVNRTLQFFDQNGPITVDGCTFEGGYTSLVSSGDCDFLTDDTLWDLKVIKQAPTKKHTLQLLMYYLMGQKSIHTEFKTIEKIGIFNPRLNKVYTLAIKDISHSVITEVSQTVIGY